MSDSATPTKWIVAGLVLGGVVVISLIVLLASLRDGGSTRTVESTSPSSSSTTTPTSAVPDQRPTSTEPSDVVVETLELRVGGADRTSIVISPAAPSAEPVPAVVVLHGLGVNAQAMSRTAAWREAVARDGFVAVFPQGTNDSWNMGPCCPPANLTGVADRAFLDALVADLTSRPDVDTDRMYLTGFSNGALMVYAYGCEHPEVFAAIAPMAGTNVTGCRPAVPLSLLHQHGDADLVVPYGGGVALGSLLSSAPFPPVQDSVAAWAAADGCDTEPSVTPGPDVERTVWSGCADGTRVELVRVTGKGHEWLRSGAYDPLAELLTFFGIG